MKRMLSRLALLAWTALTTVNSFAQWPSDASQNLMICDHFGEQALPKIAATAEGGCYILWYDHSTNNYDVFLQRLDADGIPQWNTPCGILVSANPQETWLTDWDMTVDPADHCIIVVNDIRAGGDWDIYGYRISPAGDFIWGNDGIALSVNADFEPDPRVVVTSGGNIAVAWQQSTAEGTVVNLRKLTPEGDDVYSPATITVTAPNPLSIPRLAAADNDAVLLQYLVQQGPEFWQPRHIYMQKYDSLGNELWFEDGTAVMTTNGIGVQMRPDLVHDGAGGAYSFWYDTRNNDHHVFVQHLNELGVAQWTANGVNCDNSTGELQMSPDLVRVADGVVVYYQATNTSQSQGGLQVQKLNLAGELLWDTGIVVAPLSAEPCFNVHCFQHENSTVVFYSQYAPGSAINTLLKAAKHTPAGPPEWDPAVRDLCSVNSEKGRPYVCMNPLGQMIAAWPDSRNESGDIYLQNINPDGSLGPLGEPQPWIEIISPAQDTTINVDRVTLVFEVGEFEVGVDGVIYITATNGEWELNGVSGSLDPFVLGAIDGLPEEGDWMVVADLRPSPTDPPIEGAADFVRVTYAAPSITITSPPQDTSLWDSSHVDISFVVQNFEVAESGGDGWIHIVVWFTPGVPEPVIYADLDYYTLDPYDLIFDGFGDYQVIFTLVDNAGMPLEPSASDTVMIYYVCIAVDDTPDGIPNRFALHPAYPNPFNPETTIRYDVQQTSQVRLTVYDLMGRSVVTLMDEVRDAGRYSLLWQGMNSAGQSLPSGVYFVKMTAGEFVGTQKLMLIR